MELGGVWGDRLCARTPLECVNARLWSVSFAIRGDNRMA